MVNAGLLIPTLPFSAFAPMSDQECVSVRRWLWESRSGFAGNRWFSFLHVELRPPGVEACSGSWLTRQVGKEQPSPRLENTGNSQYFFSSPNTCLRFLLKPKLKPFLSVLWWNMGALNTSKVDLFLLTSQQWYPKREDRLTENIAAAKNKNMMWNLAWVSGRPFVQNLMKYCKSVAAMKRQYSRE